MGRPLAGFTERADVAEAAPLRPSNGLPNSHARRFMIAPFNVSQWKSGSTDSRIREPSSDHSLPPMVTRDVSCSWSATAEDGLGGSHTVLARQLTTMYVIVCYYWALCQPARPTAPNAATTCEQSSHQRNHLAHVAKDALWPRTARA